MTAAYLLAIIAAAAAVGAIAGRARLGLRLGALVPATAVTAAVFLGFDAAGAAGGWFWSSPRWNLLIVPPGIPVEEPLLLVFLAGLAIVLWRIAAGILGED